MSSQLEDMAARGRCLRVAAPDTWPLVMAALSEELERQFDSTDALVEVARAVAEIAHELDCGAVAGASALGMRIARASIVSSKNGLRMFDPQSPATAVLVIDGILASGVQTARMARSARSAGAKHTPAVAVLADPQALKRCREVSADAVFALREL